MAKKKEITKGVTVALTIAQIEFIDRNFRNRSAGIREALDLLAAKRRELAKTPAEVEAEERANKALIDEAARKSLWFDLESIPIFSQRWDDMRRNKRLGRPVTYTFTEFVVECRKRRPEVDAALLREVAGEVWNECAAQWELGPVVPP